MKNKSRFVKIITATLCAAVIIIATVVPSFAFNTSSNYYPTTGYQPLSVIYYDDDNEILTLSVGNIAFDGTIETVLGDMYETVTIGNSVLGTLGSVYDLYTYAPTGYPWHIDDLWLFFDNVVGNYDDEYMTIFNEVSIITDYPLMDNGDSALSALIAFEIFYYDYNNDDGTSIVLTSEDIEVEVTGLSAAEFSRDAEGNQWAVLITDALNDIVNSTLADLPVFDGLGVVPFSISGLNVSIDSAVTLPTYGVDYVLTVQPPSNVNYGNLLLPTLPMPGNNVDYDSAYQAGYNAGVDAGYDAGFADGYLDGYNQGVEESGGSYTDGYNAGYNNGYSAGDSAGYVRGYDYGYDVGYDAGVDAGYDAGDSAGYVRGYDEGYLSGAEGYNSVGEFVAGTITSFLDTPLFGDLTIGGIMLIVISIPLVVVFLKKFAGG